MMKKYMGPAARRFIFLLLVFGTASLIWGLCNYGNIGMEEILFTMRMPLKGVSYNYYLSYGLSSVLPTLLVACLLFFCRGTVRRIRRPGWCWGILYLGWLLVLLLVADSSFGIVDYIKSQTQKSTFIEEHYVDAGQVELTFPEKKRNLILIFMESAESSSQDQANGGLMGVNLIPEMTTLARENVSFSQSDQIEGAAVAPASGWTMAGLVAETAGVPLKLFAYDDSRVDNSMKYYQHFLPGVSSLGDILMEEGYHNCFMAGSDFDFGGRTNYFTQHGNYEICDLKWARDQGKVASNYSNGFWGIEDQLLYRLAEEKLTELAAKGEPFNFSLLTVDTHQPNGYICSQCQMEHGSQYANVWSCASRQVAAFVAWIQSQDFYDNTSIVIVGDHCSMVSDFYSYHSYDKHNGSTDRKVYNAFIHPDKEAVRMKNRKFTTLDFFPTILGSLGVRIEGDRLGLGTDLFSGKETLVEEYGYEAVFTELNKVSDYYNEELLYPGRR